MSRMSYTIACKASAKTWTRHIQAHARGHYGNHIHASTCVIIRHQSINYPPLAPRYFYTNRPTDRRARIVIQKHTFAGLECTCMLTQGRHPEAAGACSPTGLLNSRSWGRCPTTRWQWPFRPQSRQDNSRGCRDRPAHLTITTWQIKLETKKTRARSSSCILLRTICMPK